VYCCAGSLRGATQHPSEENQIRLPSRKAFSLRERLGCRLSGLLLAVAVLARASRPADWNVASASLLALLAGA